MVDIAASVWELVKVVNQIVTLIDKLRNNPQHSKSLKEQAEILKERLGTADTPSQEAFDLTKKELKAAFDKLKSVTKRNCLMRCWKASEDSATLVEVERKLESLTTQVVVVERILHLASRIGNENIHLPANSVALDQRAAGVLDFLQQSKSQNLRVVAIHGQPGIGKTTILKYVWDKVAREAPFAARAFIQIGHDATQETIRKSQTSILRQIGDCNKKFPSTDFGKGDFEKYLKQQKGAVFLAIDNVFRAEDLENLLPERLGSENLPAASCIVMTCRAHNIVESLLSICLLQEGDNGRVCCVTPKCLNPADSKSLFKKCANMVDSAPKDQELVDELVPLCGGLPLALTILGRVFTNEGRRVRKEWQLVQKRWEEMDEGDLDSAAKVSKALRLSFDYLEKKRQVAFLDMVSTFYGWPVERMQAIVGEEIVRDLINSSLVLIVDGIDKCNQNALREGCMDDYLKGHPKLLGRDEHYSYSAFISMHDLTLSFGESLIRDGTSFGYKQIGSTLLSTFKADEFRSVRLSSSTCNREGVLDFLQCATSLSTLVLRETREGKEKASIDWGTICKEEGHKQGQKLQRLTLSNCISIMPIMETKVSHEIKEIALWSCDDIKELPTTPLPNLERLKISECKNFEGFSASCVTMWGKLKHLRLVALPKVTRLPVELGQLRSLEAICVAECHGLKEFPSLKSSSNGPSTLVLHDCCALETLGPISCPLQELSLQNLAIQMLEVPGIFRMASSLQILELDRNTRLKTLPADIGTLTTLISLNLADCEELVELPEQIFEGLSSLKFLRLTYCRKLKKLPDSLCSITSFEELDLSGCASLTELPEQIGSLSSLMKLVLGGCKQLQKLPASIFSNTSLEELDLSGCVSLTELPEEIGSLSSLKSLSLMNCRQLQKLPNSICSITSLKQLNLNCCENLTEIPEQIGSLISWPEELQLTECEQLQNLSNSIRTITSLKELELFCCKSLTELPEQLGSLSSLKKLNLWGCRQLQKLPDSICSIMSLEKLVLTSSESLTELPEQIGSLSSLKSLALVNCRQLQKLPASICSNTSLEELNLIGCVSLTELLEEIGSLSSLKSLTLGNCRQLQKLPDSICSIMSLEKLDLPSCESLTELPEQIGGLSSLKSLTLRNCRQLQKLPDSICSITSLEELDLTSCESLTELPEQIGSLISSSKKLTLRDCRQLQKLPNSICSITSLEELDLFCCESLTELPEQLGSLSSLKSLTLENCRELQKLPDSICSITSLEKLDLFRCESLTELPEQQMGSLSSLKSLTLRITGSCKNSRTPFPASSHLRN